MKPIIIKHSAVPPGLTLPSNFILGHEMYGSEIGEVTPANYSPRELVKWFKVEPNLRPAASEWLMMNTFEGAVNTPAVDLLTVEITGACIQSARGRPDYARYVALYGVPTPRWPSSGATVAQWTARNAAWRPAIDAAWMLMPSWYYTGTDGQPVYLEQLELIEQWRGSARCVCPAIIDHHEPVVRAKAQKDVWGNPWLDLDHPETKLPVLVDPASLSQHVTWARARQQVCALWLWSPTYWYCLQRTIPWKDTTKGDSQGKQIPGSGFFGGRYHPVNAGTLEVQAWYVALEIEATRLGVRPQWDELIVTFDDTEEHRARRVELATAIVTPMLQQTFAALA